jgi:hypothetical protein
VRCRRENREIAIFRAFPSSLGAVAKEYCDYHPDLADEIRDVFEAVLMIEDLKLGPDDVSGTFGESIQRNDKRLTQVGDHRILWLFGHGDMGVVYETVGRLVRIAQQRRGDSQISSVGHLAQGREAALTPHSRALGRLRASVRPTGARYQGEPLSGAPGRRNVLMM